MRQRGREELWLVLMLVMGLIIAAPWILAWGANAQGRARAEPTPAVEAQRVKTLLGPYPAIKPEMEELYIRQSLCAIDRLGLHRGCQWDAQVDWLFGREFTYRPWDWGGWRDSWSKTPGERFARWWVGYCVAHSCEACEGEGCAEIEAAMGEGFDAELAKITE